MTSAGTDLKRKLTPGFSIIKCSQTVLRIFCELQDLANGAIMSLNIDLYDRGYEQGNKSKG
jgi:hypothetical protein